MTSCVETYRLATWRSDAPGKIAIQEDRAVGYEADLKAIDDRRLDLRLHLKNEQVDLSLEAAAVPYVCPDLRR